MDFWKANFARSWVDTFDAFSGGKIVIGVLIFVIGYLIAHNCREPGTAKKMLHDSLWGILTFLIAFLIVFAFHLFELSPVRIYREQQANILDLRATTNDFQSRLAEKADAEWKSSLVYQRQKALQYDLETIAEHFQQTADGFTTNPNDSNMRDDMRMNYMMDTVEPIVKRAEQEGLDISKLLKVTQNAISSQLRSLTNMQSLYRESSMESKKLAGQLPKKPKQW